MQINKNVVIPLLNDIEKILIIISYMDLGLREEIKLIRNPNLYFGKKTKIIYVKQGENKNNELIGDNEPIDFEKINNEDKIESGTVLKLSSIQTLDWCFVPYNPKDIERKRKLEEEFENSEKIDIDKIIDENSGDHVLNNFEEIKEKCRNLCNSNKEINESSMLLYSGSLKQRDDLFLVSFHRNRLLCNYLFRPYFTPEALYRVGCIYTGDTNLKKITVKEVFNDYWKSVVTIQIPHHGSIENFNEDFFDFNGVSHDSTFYFCPISARKNGYEHPSSFVISSILSNNGLPIIINESPDSLLIQTIYSHSDEKKQVTL